MHEVKFFNLTKKAQAEANLKGEAITEEALIKEYERLGGRWEKYEIPVEEQVAKPVEKPKVARAEKEVKKREDVKVKKLGAEKVR